MSEVKIKRGTVEEINNTDIIDGQLLFTTDQDESSLFIDIGTVRKQIGSNKDIEANEISYGSSDVESALNGAISSIDSNTRSIEVANGNIQNVQTQLTNIASKIGVVNFSSFYCGQGKASIEMTPPSDGRRVILVICGGGIGTVSLGVNGDITTTSHTLNNFSATYNKTTKKLELSGLTWYDIGILIKNF